MPDRAEIEALRAAAKRVLEADMRGVRDLDALNALEDAAGFTQQGQRRSPQGEDHEALYETVRIAAVESSDEWLRTRAQEVLARVSPSRDGTAAVDQPEPDALGGLPPSQPKEDQ